MKRRSIYGKVPDKYWKTKKPFIVKMQLPLLTNGKQEMLIYSKDRKWQFTYPIYGDILALFRDRLKIYCECWFTKEGQLYINKIINSLNW